ncbi:MAG: hypothetical protein FJ253_02895 [Phycisphaerae bacterium]|nr:hypothetical protein [Phycisphaerae bacterium]
MGGSHWSAVTGGAAAAGKPEPPGVDGSLPRVDLERGPKTARAVAQAISRGLVRSAHDPSEGGLLVAVAEMAMAGRVGCSIELANVPARAAAVSAEALAFAEDPSRYLLEVEPSKLDALRTALADLPFAVIGTTVADPALSVELGGANGRVSWKLDEVREAWSRGAELP